MMLNHNFRKRFKYLWKITNRISLSFWF